MKFLSFESLNTSRLLRFDKSCASTFEDFLNFQLTHSENTSLKVILKMALGRLAKYQIRRVFSDDMCQIFLASFVWGFDCGKYIGWGGGSVVEVGFRYWISGGWIVWVVRVGLWIVGAHKD